MNVLIAALLIVLGLALLLGVNFFLERERTRIWTTGTEAERFEDRIGYIEAIWSVNDVQPELRKELRDDLRSFCIDAQAQGATALDVFGDDVEAFAQSWVTEHRQPPSQLRITVLEFTGYVMVGIALRSVPNIFRHSPIARPMFHSSSTSWWPSPSL